MEPSRLPIWNIMPSVLGALRRGQNIILSAAPGSGKTTQVPQALLDNNLAKGTIVVVQPRRVACRAAARRIAEERGAAPGEEIGYIVRHDAKRGAATRVLFVTDGVLLRFLERDPCLPWAGAVLFDEFHERRASTDVALGLLRTAQLRRPSLRLLAMSATMEHERIQKFLNAQAFSAEGRSYPVEVQYSPAETLQETLDAAATRVLGIHAEAVSGDILVFLPGKEEIKSVQKAIATRASSNLTVLPLHGELTRHAQDRVFVKANGRKVILATNIAETSVTIPGIRTVIDAGFERRADFDPALGINRLALSRVSKAAADQRAGRAGREAPGRCIRLWSRETHEQLEDYAPVEMQRTDLASVVLTLKSLGIQDPAKFNFLDPPSPERLRAAEEYLVQLGAVSDGLLTPTGWRMLRLPLPPRYARMVVESERSGCLKEVASIAALMAGRPILALSPEGKRRGEAKVHFARDDSSDFFSLLAMFFEARLYRWSEEWCERHGINSEALKEAIHLRRKIIHVAFSRGAPSTFQPGKPAAIRRCILSGLVDRVAQREKGREYRLINGLGCVSDAATVVKGQLIVAADIRSIPVRRQFTSSAQAALSFITRIDPEMLLQVAPHLVQRIRLPIELDRETASLRICEEIRYQDIALERHSVSVDILEAVKVLAEQKERASHHGWHRVEVLPSIGRKPFILWQGKKFPITADGVGSYWAVVSGTRNTNFTLKERIVVLPGTQEEPPLPPVLTEKVTRTGSAVAKLLGRNT